ncbi:MAG: hypothetical protein NC084_05650 [Bacteroides sp.]|nr:hypothetical protein [Eubacterium sp.]MCM1417995.1 hypothetical protein [Roseburia sp.]MCM1462182.1 hypothetical protein [Bacteroides sp.]
MAYYLALPVILALLGLIKKKAPSCFFCGLAIFLFLALTLPENTALGESCDLLLRYPVSMIGGIGGGVGLLLPAKLFLTLFPSLRALTTAIAALLALGTATTLYRSETPAFSALLAACLGFLPLAAGDPALYAAALTTAIALRFAAERRFLRYAALILVAACFRAEAILFLLLYFLLIPPPGLILFLGGTAATAALLLTDVSDPVFAFLNAEIPSYFWEGFSPAIPATLGGLALLAALMRRMFPKNREREYETALNLLFAAAFLALIGVYKPEYCVPAMIAAFPSVLLLGGALLKLADRLIALTFKEKKKPVRIVGAALGLILLGGFYLWLLAENGIITR